MAMSDFVVIALGGTHGRVIWGTGFCFPAGRWCDSGKFPNFAETLVLVHKMGTVVPVPRDTGGWGEQCGSVPAPGPQGHSSVNGLESLGPGGAGPQRRAGPLTALWVQPARLGPSDPAAQRSAAVNGGTHVHATGETAAAPARQASGASCARTVSVECGVLGGPGAG